MNELFDPESNNTSNGCSDIQFCIIFDVSNVNGIKSDFFMFFNFSDFSVSFVVFISLSFSMISFTKSLLLLLLISAKSKSLLGTCKLFYVNIPYFRKNHLRTCHYRCYPVNVETNHLGCIRRGLDILQ